MGQLRVRQQPLPATGAAVELDTRPGTSVTGRQTGADDESEAAEDCAIAVT
jgi:hypothetical protein